jgi:ABC-2 type transport system permease protein
VLPVMSLAFLFGGVSAAEVLIALAGLVATAVFYASVGLFWSTVTRSSLGATSFALGTIIMMLLGIPFLVVIFGLVFTSDVSSDLLESAVFIYLSRLFIATHPFIALGVTETQLSAGGSPFFEAVPAGGAELLVPSPWLLYVLLSLVFSAVLVSLSVRMLQPTQPAPAPAPRKAATPAE